MRRNLINELHDITDTNLEIRFKLENNLRYFDFSDFEILKQYFVIRANMDEWIPNFINSLDSAINDPKNTEVEHYKQIKRNETAELRHFYLNKIKLLIKKPIEVHTFTGIVYQDKGSEKPSSYDKEKKRYVIRNFEGHKIYYWQSDAPRIYPISIVWLKIIFR